MGQKVMVCTLPPYRFFLESLEPFSTLPDRIASILNTHKSILPFYYGQLFVSPKYLPLYSIRLETHYLSENQQNPQKLVKPTTFYIISNPFFPDLYFQLIQPFRLKGGVVLHSFTSCPGHFLHD